MKTVLKLLSCYSDVSSQQLNYLKRFYKQSNFIINPQKTHHNHNYIIQLDSKTIKTPYRHHLAVPNKILAMLITAEFNRQTKHIKPGQMPILALCRTAVDADLQGHLSDSLKHSIFQYLKTDSLLFTHWNYKKIHKKIALPLIEDFQQRFDMILPLSDSLNAPEVKISKNFIEWVDNLNNWQLIGLQTMTIWLKSTISACSIVNKGISVGQARVAATLEESIQMEHNGLVQQKVMDINQIQLMASCGEMMFRYGKPDF